MDISVVVPTLNARDELAGCLDALAEHAPEVEVIVVNGPSADGTTGMVKERDVVDILVEIPDRTVNAARNAGIGRADGDAVAFLDHRLSVTGEWRDAVTAGLETADVVTGPTQTQLRAGMETEEIESREIVDRSVTYFNRGNVAFRREPLARLDGFDEYLAIGGARDLAHRIAGAGYTVVWDDDACVRKGIGADGGERERDWGWKYRSLAYRLLKNYGPRPTILGRLARHAGVDAGEQLLRVLRGEVRASWWLGTGRTVLTSLAVGAVDGLRARRRDDPPRRNPEGWSSGSDRAVAVYDWR